MRHILFLPDQDPNRQIETGTLVRLDNWRAKLGIAEYDQHRRGHVLPDTFGAGRMVDRGKDFCSGALDGRDKLVDGDFDGILALSLYPLAGGKCLRTMMSATIGQLLQLSSLSFSELFVGSLWPAAAAGSQRLTPEFDAVQPE